jgi:exosome complex component RRP4
MIQMIKNLSDCRIFVGQNGRIWVDGDDENVQVAVDAIKLIEKNAQSSNLTDKIKDFIESKLPQTANDDDYDLADKEEE